MKPWFCNDSPHPSQTKWCGCHALPIALTKGPLLLNHKKILKEQETKTKSKYKRRVPWRLSLFFWLLNGSFSLSWGLSMGKIISKSISFCSSKTDYFGMHEIRLGMQFNCLVSDAVGSKFSRAFLSGMEYRIHRPQWEWRSEGGATPPGSINAAGRLNGLPSWTNKIKRKWRFLLLKLLYRSFIFGLILQAFKHFPKSVVLS